jgi:hypothetical protein
MPYDAGHYGYDRAGQGEYRGGGRRDHLNQGRGEYRTDGQRGYRNQSQRDYETQRWRGYGAQGDRDYQGQVRGHFRSPRQGDYGEHDAGDAYGFRSGAYGGPSPADPHPRHASRRPYGVDYWWLGEREVQRQGYASAYDEAYRRFSAATRPRFSPVGGMYPAVSGSYTARRWPRPLREPTRFSDWTRWF